MILGLGLDVVEVARIGRILAEGAPGDRGRRFLDRCFTPGEQATCEARRDRASGYAARFAAKEAVMKALGAPPGIRFTDIEVVREGGAPWARLAGAAERAARERGVSRVHLTMTHDGGVAAAAVVLEGEGAP
ncbi:MAG TPA: holo-ACP synthase [Anaeromyxobacteraceae bacterium]|nr:holo-ACP synthase [Anaeromyxobacteraceae bacterium]